MVLLVYGMGWIGSPIAMTLIVMTMMTVTALTISMSGGDDDDCMGDENDEGVDNDDGDDDDVK